MWKLLLGRQMLFYLRGKKATRSQDYKSWKHPITDVGHQKSMAEIWQSNLSGSRLDGGPLHKLLTFHICNSAIRFRDPPPPLLVLLLQCWWIKSTSNIYKAVLNVLRICKSTLTFPVITFILPTVNGSPFLVAEDSPIPYEIVLLRAMLRSALIICIIGWK